MVSAITKIQIMCHQNAESILKLLPGFSSQSTDLILKSFNGFYLLKAKVVNPNDDRSPVGTNICEVGRYHATGRSGEFGNYSALKRTCLY